MKRILSIDFGEKRIGIAVTDPTQTIASPLETVDIAKIIVFLTNYLQNNKVEKIVLGFPKNLDGSLSATSYKVEKFKKVLEKNFKQIEVVLFDEKFTSKLASRDMFLYGFSRKDRHNKSNIDKVSAAILLQFFMDFKPKQTSNCD